MKQKIALAGTPNCGKTTFWNLVTGRRGKIGNWPGVTAEKLSAPLKAFPDIELTDLPGIYSLSAGSLEEVAAEKYLKNGGADAIIIIIDGTKPEQGLFLALELLCLGIPSVIGINFADELRAQSTTVDTVGLSTDIGSPVFLISAKKNKNINALLSAAKTTAKKTLPKSTCLSVKKRHIKAAELSEKYFASGKVNKNAPFPAALFLIPVLMVLGFLFLFASPVLKENIFVFFEHATALLSALMNYLKVPFVLKGLVADGIITGFASAVSFLPELSVLFLALAFLEDSGYMARFAFGTDFLLKKIGLSGRSMIPLLLGFGCCVPGVCAAKSSDSEDARSRTLSMLMFVPCSARLPLMLLVCETVFPNFIGGAVFFFYLTVLAVGGIFSFIQTRRRTPGFILELPPIRLPSIGSVIKSAWRRLYFFIAKAFGMVVLTCVLIWVLKNFSILLEPVEFQSESALSAIGRFLSPIFAPIGIPYEGAVALFCGLFAKESALFALTSLRQDISTLFTPVSAVSFLLFFMIYSPCLACLATILHEFGRKKAFWLFIRQNALAYFVSLAFYQFALLIQNIFIP